MTQTAKQNLYARAFYIVLTALVAVLIGVSATARSEVQGLSDEITKMRGTLHQLDMKIAGMGELPPGWLIERVNDNREGLKDHKEKGH